MTVQDIFALRKQGKIEEAEKIYKALLRLIPSIEDDKEKSVAGFMHYAEGRLTGKATDRILTVPDGEMANFMRVYERAGICPVVVA